VKGKKPAEVRGIDLAKPENEFFAPSSAQPFGTAPPMAEAGTLSQLLHRDPWYKTEDATEYFVSRTAARLVNGQKLGVFVLHDKQIALAGFVDAERGAALLGLGLLGVGCVMLVGNLWMLRRTLRKESSADNA